MNGAKQPSAAQNRAQKSAAKSAARRKTARYRLAGLGAAAAALALGVLAAQPIYRSPWLWIVAAAALVITQVVVWLKRRWRLRPPVVIALLLAAFIVTVVPVAVPQALNSGSLQAGMAGLIDGLAATVLGWKQLLTLTLPVGTYRTTLVPFYLVALATAMVIALLADKSRRVAAWAAVPMLVPVAFGTIFGAAEVSPAAFFGPLRFVAPHETLLWLTIVVLAAIWTAWTSSSDRRAALQLGRAAGDSAVRRGGAGRAAAAAVIIVGCLAAGTLLAPVLDTSARAVPRDRVDPELVVRERPSPLAAYRAAKTNDEIDRVMFAVAGANGVPERLRLAVLDAYDGIDFHVSGGAAGLFTRFPSGEPLQQAGDVEITVGDGYADIWAPVATLGSPPVFTGPRADALADGFYVNRTTGGAIAFSGAGRSAVGLADDDGYRAQMELAPAAGLLGDPTQAGPLFDLETTPELASWVEAQGVTPDAKGLAALVEMLRERGYLSHSLTDNAGELTWLTRLADEHGTRFESSAGGHSLARIETLFAQLNQQQRAAGAQPRAGMLVAAVGDDEQFATAVALVARALGYESRVVVGVRTGAGVPGVPACAADCTGDSLAAWVEVRGAEGAWVTFDVTPQAAARPQRIEEGEQLPEHPTAPEERDAREIDPPIGLGEQNENSGSEPQAETDAWLGAMLRVIALSTAAAACLALPLIFLPVAKRLRTRARRRDSRSEMGALGAWAEMVDRARDAGVDIPASATRSEVAAAIGTSSAAWVAREVDRAIFAPSQISAEETALLWDAVRADRSERRSSMTLWQRIAAMYSLRSYGIDMGRQRVRTPTGGAA